MMEKKHLKSGRSGTRLNYFRLNAPKMDGLEVAREVRKTHDMPIIMVTAKDSEIDKVLGLELEPMTM